MKNRCIFEGIVAGIVAVVTIYENSSDPKTRARDNWPETHVQNP